MGTGEDLRTREDPRGVQGHGGDAAGEGGWVGGKDSSRIGVAP